MYHAKLHDTIQPPWTAMEPIRVDPVPTGVGTPGAYVTVERGGQPFARIDIWPTSRGPFRQIEVWKQFIVVGWNEQAYLVDPLTHQVSRMKCEGYFGHFYPVDGCLLIADARRLVCLGGSGALLWQSDIVGSDGVVVDEVRDGIIAGQGEWDPPGGWKPFWLSMATGEPVAK